MTEKRRLRKGDMQANAAASYFLECYEYALNEPSIRKPISWSLYQTWKVYNENEKERDK